MCMIGDVKGVRKGPVTGWRVWKVDSNGELWPIFKWGRWETEMRSDYGPLVNNGSGLWAYKSRKKAEQLRRNGDSRVVGRVRLTGKIIAHEKGYRASRATILGIVRTHRKHMQIIKRYGVKTLAKGK